MGFLTKIKGRISLQRWRRFAAGFTNGPSPKSGRKFGAFIYRTCNIGDEVQTLAVLPLLPKVGNLEPIDRDGSIAYQGSPAVVIFNGWHTHLTSSWPPNDRITPIFEGFHLATPELLDRPGVTDYLKRWGEIRCRDTATASLLNSRGIEAKFGGCPTTLLKRPRTANPSEILVIDAHTDRGAISERAEVKAHLRELVPASILEKAVYLTQDVGDDKRADDNYKIRAADARLQRLAGAKLVITNRLHVALPCLAFGTPCVFMHGDVASDPRLGDYVPYLNFSCSAAPLKDYPWDRPTAKPLPPFVAELRQRLESKIAAFC